MERRSRLAEWLRRRPGAPGGTARGSAAAADREALLLGAAAASFPVAPAAHPSGFGCSCDRVGCPTPGMHPVSFAWQTEATTDAAKITRWLLADPLANFVTATGAGHDVLDVPAQAGRIALARLEAEGTGTGPVAMYGDDRMLFFTASRGTPDDEDEWWPCELDCHPETLDEHPGLRWHCRGSYVLLPPSRLPDGSAVTWLRPADRPLPDPLPLLAVLTDACGQVPEAPEPEAAGGWPSR
ncbi:bifunctional DNA primase/polymerase [Streptomyces sp. ICBB 8177]|uniref:bifunctional DNA primase/polymerase n=1 Tax=Streptomyces sp. ICBB 8177 TaxID=563922 RepID=UPI000D681930|nr:bifunctional DNA primase/polymerase [Streptomyces sp. ICBB 8177]PWI43267.1 DNA primase [Streptomyces sp. ICBB 8177]